MSTQASAPKQIRLTSLAEDHQALRGELEAAFARVLDSNRFLLGDEVAELEREVAELCGAREAVACASGSDALLLSLMALGVRAGDEVLCPAYSFFATAGSIARLGATPLFVDIDPASYTIDLAAAKRVAAERERAKAIVPVQLFGHAPDMRALETDSEFARLAVVNDAAQALGSRDPQGRPTGSTGDTTCFSFYPTKNLGGLGDGGMVMLDDAGLAQAVRELRTHGSSGSYEHTHVGLNSRLDSIQAAALRVKLPHIERWSAARVANAEHYDELFRAAGAEDASSTSWDDEGATLRVPPLGRGEGGRSHVFHQYVIRVPAPLRDPLRTRLADSGVESAVYYPIPLHLQPCFADSSEAARPNVALADAAEEGVMPHAEAASRETLALPCHPSLDSSDRERVAATVLDFLRKAERPRL